MMSCYCLILAEVLSNRHNNRLPSSGVDLPSHHLNKASPIANVENGKLRDVTAKVLKRLSSSQAIAVGMGGSVRISLPSDFEAFS